jgi:hypothetical protein
LKKWILLILLLLSVCDDIADLFIVNVASHIWGKGSPQIGHLRERKTEGEAYNSETLRGNGQSPVSDSTQK